MVFFSRACALLRCSFLLSTTTALAPSAIADANANANGDGDDADADDACHAHAQAQAQTHSHSHANNRLHRGDDDANDHIDSDTPRSGVATPQPDLSDKRLPGIMHSYFGQVVLRSCSLALLRPAFLDIAIIKHSLNPGRLLSALRDFPFEFFFWDFLPLPRPPSMKPTLRLTPSMEKSRHFPPNEQAGFLRASEQSQHPNLLHPYPTPPVSQPSSPHKLKLSDTSDDDASQLHVKRASKSASTHQRSISGPIPSRASSTSLLPLPGIVTISHVHAAHFSKPSNCHLATVPTSTPPPCSHIPSQSQESSAASCERLKLTYDVRHKKSIPPTPRALSNQTNTSNTSGGSDSAQAQNGQNGNEQKEQKEPKKQTVENGLSQNGKPPAAEAMATLATVEVTGAPAPTPKGKLTVKITEARGLRKSREPYVVAVFQRNELVSKGPIPEVDDEPEDTSTIPMGGIPIQRTASDSGRPMAIPMKSRQSSNTSQSDKRDFKAKGRRSFTNPKWDTEAVFDVVDSDSRVNLTIYDQGSAAEEFLGHVDLEVNLTNDSTPLAGWFPLCGKNDNHTGLFGQIYVEITFQRIEKRHYGPEDFQILKLIGKGTFGQVYQVRKRDTKRIYAMKVLQKKVIVQKKEVAHTVGERNILVRTAMADSPFIVGLKFSFQTPTDLYLVTDFMSGGELFWHLQKEGRFDEKRAKFYIAELILALQHLHMHDIVYRDLKPENILLDANGHIALCDFGLSKANLTKNATTNTFCGTTEYLAPEVLLDEQGYTKMVDFWSLGVLVFEMCCGWSPFYAEDTQQMYKNIAFGKVRFPKDTLSTEGRNFVKGLLNRNPKHRLGAQDDAEELKVHPFFADIDWDALAKKLITPPFKPKLKSETDTQNFDPEFTNALNAAGSLNARAALLAAGVDTSTPLSPGMQANFKGFTFVDESSLQEHMQHLAKDDYDMDDDDEREREDWEDPFGAPEEGRRGDRMSGIVKTNTNEDSNMFNGEHFDM
ncbi:Protein kinase-like (PK-like) [Venustampulla echinocandica]|uniref:non-specific serine/threonine protein kinase n=1 Tax=Venustampulla echinocandica TaxID=2656787 RepID=A0A370U356_9HELO|nr:Protein kinase-like (PK-like) [Venustampulla echinocandica]RDL42202.1 Protein kinase-like (PK-like) [Venustampulla echinocandica]